MNPWWLSQKQSQNEEPIREEGTECTLTGRLMPWLLRRSRRWAAFRGDFPGRGAAPGDLGSQRKRWMFAGAR